MDWDLAELQDLPDTELAEAPAPAVQGSFRGLGSRQGSFPGSRQGSLPGSRQGALPGSPRGPQALSLSPRAPGSPRTQASNISPRTTGTRSRASPRSRGSRTSNRSNSNASKQNRVKQQAENSLLLFWFSGQEFDCKQSLPRSPNGTARGSLKGRPKAKKGEGEKVFDNNKKKRSTGDRKEMNSEISGKSGAGVKDMLDEEEDSADGIEDWLESDVGGPAVEEKIRQHWPIFIVLQCLVTFLLWFICCLKEYGWENLLSSTGGLETLFPNQTTLLVHVDCEDYRVEVWRWWTYQFTHSKISHIAMNVFLAIVVGIPLEGFQGTWRVALMFTCGVLSGGAGHVIFNPHKGSSPLSQQVVGLVGMSGGCYTLLGAHMGNLIMNWAQMRFRKPMLAGLLLLIVIDIVQVQVDTEGEGIAAHSAHLGGWIAGLIIGICLGRNLVLTRCECVARVTAALIAVGMVSLLVVWLFQWPPMSLWDLVPWCLSRQVINYTAFGDYDYHCIRCNDQACIDKWQQQTYVAVVDWEVCNRVEGWAVTER